MTKFRIPSVASTYPAMAPPSDVMIVGDECIQPRRDVVDTFICRNRKCVVVRMQFPGTIGMYHNGYVECEQGTEFDNMCVYICGEEITFHGELSGLPDGKYYIGFDTCHYYNDQHPETKTAEHVKARCQEIAYQLDKEVSDDS